MNETARGTYDMSAVNHTNQLFDASSSIRRKLTAIIMGVSAAALVISGVLVVFSQMAAFRQSMALDHAQQAEMIANNCLAAVSFNDQEDAALVLRTLARRTSLAYASVSKADGEVLAFYRRDGFSEDPLHFTADGKHMFTSIWLLAQAPIVLDGEIIGTAFLQSDLRELAVFWRTITTIVAASLLTVFLMAWVASFRLQKLISAPIERLTEIVREVSRHRDYSIRAENTSRDEIGVLASAFNEMLSEVENRDEQLARAERMESIVALAGGVAHDLNNILGPLVALPELIEDDVRSITPDNPTVQAGILDSLGMMKTSANRAASVVRDLLDLSRRGYHYERTPTDINRMPSLSRDSGCISSLGESCPDVEIRIRKSEIPLPVLASEDHLCRVVDNLVRNAAEAIEGKGTVTVTTTKRHLARELNGYTTIPPGDYAIIAVADTGSGIAPEHLNRIFEPFFTRKKQTRHSGSGLGLSIVHGIIDDHRGYINVESEVGRGTTFSLYLPLTSPVACPVEPDEQPLVGGKGRILVVDDEPGQRFLARSCLSRLGYTAELAGEGRSAVRLFTEAKAGNHAAPYDLIVLDMRMEPGFDGLDTLKGIRALYPEQKVLIASGHAEDDRSMAAMALGAKWLSKPYSPNDLARAIAEMLDADNA